MKLLHMKHFFYYAVFLYTVKFLLPTCRKYWMYWNNLYTHYSHLVCVSSWRWKVLTGFCCGEIHNLFEECRSQFKGDSEIEERFDHGDSDVRRVDDVAICEVILVKLTLKQKKIARKFLLGRREQLCWTKGSLFALFWGPNKVQNLWLS